VIAPQPVVRAPYQVRTGEAILEHYGAVAAGHATPEQDQRVREDAQRRADQAHRHAWELYEAHQARDPDSQ
jgi:hypothetical protein